MATIGGSTRNVWAKQNSTAARAFSLINAPAKMPALAGQGARASTATLQQGRALAITGALQRLDGALNSVKYYPSTTGKVARFEAIEETLPNWVRKDVFEERSVGFETQILAQRPTYGAENVYEDRAVFSETPLYDLRDLIERRNVVEKRNVYESRPVIETRNVYGMRDVIENRPVYETRAIYEDRDLFEIRAVFETRNVYESRNVYETRDVFETQNVYETRDVFETRPVYEQQAIHEAVVLGNRDISSFGTSSAAGIDTGADFSVAVGSGAAAIVRFTAAGRITVTQGNSTSSVDYANAPGSFSNAVLEALNKIDGIRATRDSGKLVIKARENNSLTIAEVENGFFDFSRSPLAALGLTAGRTNTSVTRYRQVQTGTQQVKVGTEQVLAGTRQVKTGTEQVLVGTEQVLTVTEQVQTGTERVKVGTARVMTGSEEIEIGRQDVVVGRERYMSGTEDVVVGTEDVLVGVEDVVVGTQDVVVGQEQVQIGVDRRQTGIERVVTGTRQVVTGEETYVADTVTEYRTERQNTGTRHEIEGTQTRLLGFRRVDGETDYHRAISSESQRAIRDGVILLQNAVGGEQLAPGVANPYFKAAKSINLTALSRAVTQDDLGAHPTQVANLLKQMKKLSGAPSATSASQAARRE